MTVFQAMSEWLLPFDMIKYIATWLGQGEELATPYNLVSFKALYSLACTCKRLRLRLYCLLWSSSSIGVTLRCWNSPWYMTCASVGALAFYIEPRIHHRPAWIHLRNRCLRTGSWNMTPEQIAEISETVFTIPKNITCNGVELLC